MSAQDFQKMMDDQQAEFQAMREAFQADLAQAQAQLAAAGIAPEAPGAQGLGPDVNSVAIRLPSFWVTAPELWFALTEASFDTRHPKITVDSSKYNHVLQALPQEVLTECKQGITTEGQNRYATLKATLIKTYGKSPATKNAELLEMNAHPRGMGCLLYTSPSPRD